MAITFVTTTSYGTWLPGDLRGYVQRGVILPSNPRLLKFAKSLLTGRPVLFEPRERDRLFDSLQTAADEFGYRVTDVSIEAWHLHWIIGHGDDSADVMVGRLKTRMRQSLGRGRIWTKGYCGEPLFDDSALQQAREYIGRHSGCRLAAGAPFDPTAEPWADGRRAMRVGNSVSTDRFASTGRLTQQPPALPGDC